MVCILRRYLTASTDVHAGPTTHYFPMWGRFESEFGLIVLLGHNSLSYHELEKRAWSLIVFLVNIKAHRAPDCAVDKMAGVLA
jgi:hypothetical protein